MISQERIFCYVFGHDVLKQQKQLGLTMLLELKRVVVEAPITHEYRHALFTSLIDLQCRIDSIYGAGVEAPPAYKKLLKGYYSFNGVPTNSIIRRYSNEYNKE